MWCVGVWGGWECGSEVGWWYVVCGIENPSQFKNLLKFFRVSRTRFRFCHIDETFLSMICGTTRDWIFSSFSDRNGV
jgi:hypothetical protein